jgi:S-methylmethionine-dependent homocysteine/selenocysteine methylase
MAKYRYIMGPNLADECSITQKSGASTFSCFRGAQMMTFREAFESMSVLLANGGVMARIMARRDIDLDPHVLHATAVFDERARPILADVYSSYADVAVRYRMPMMCSTPTLRANAERVPQSPYGDTRSVNRSCVEFLSETLGRFTDWRKHLYLAGSVGPKGDTYRPETALATEAAARFHTEQTEALVEAGVDLLVAYTLPAFVEAAGMAKAFAASDTPYVLSFVLDREGRLLDGTLLETAIDAIDDSAEQAPLFYLTNCSHSLAIRAGLTRVGRDAPHALKRIAGVRPNASPRSQTELEGLDHIATESPEDFASAMVTLREEFKLKVLGGCCGTDERHLEELAKSISG